MEWVCDRVAIVNKGRVARLDTLDGLLHEDLSVDLTLGPYDRTVLARLERLCAVSSVEEGMITIMVGHQEEIPPVVDLLVAAGVRVYGVTPRRRSLEDVFIAVVEGEARQPAAATAEPAPVG